LSPLSAAPSPRSLHDALPICCGHPSDRPGQLVACDELCTHPRQPVKQRMLTVHHLDGDKANCAWWNLAALCQVCHLVIQGRVVIDRKSTRLNSSHVKISYAVF